jgi:dihydroflavonol-4-reductase
MKVLVTGADGLLGSHLVRRLIKKGLDVRVFIKADSASPTLDDLPIEKIRGDLLSEKGGLSEAISGCDYVMHLAAIVDIRANPDITWKVNLEGTRRVLDACIDKGVKRLIYVSSASAFQFGPRENPGNETSTEPDNIYKDSAYVQSKHAATKLVLDYVKKKDLDVVIVAPTFMLGGYDFMPSSGEMIRQFINKGIKISSPGGRSFAYADDVAGGLVGALEKGKKGEIYILGGENLTYMEFFTKVAKIADMDPPKWLLPKAVVLMGGAGGSAYEIITKKQALINFQIAKLSCVGTYYTSKKAINALGMEQTPIEVGITESIKCLKEYGHIK